MPTVRQSPRYTDFYTEWIKSRTTQPGMSGHSNAFFQDTGRPMRPINEPLISPEGRTIWPGTQTAPRPQGPNQGVGTVLTHVPSEENPFKTITNIKSPSIFKAQKGLETRFSEGQDKQDLRFKDYLNQFDSIFDETREARDQGSAAVEDIYNPDGFRRRTFGEIDRYEDAIQDVAGRGFQNAMAQLSAQQMGAGSQGASSYYNQQLLDKFADINIPLQADVAAKRMANEQLIKDLELQGLGRRTALNQGFLEYLLGPIRNRQNLLGMDTQNLSGLSALDLANTWYGTRKQAEIDAVPHFSLPGASSSQLPVGGGGGGAQTEDPLAQLTRQMMAADQRRRQQAQRTVTPSVTQPFLPDSVMSQLPTPPTQAGLPFFNPKIDMGPSMSGSFPVSSDVGAMIPNVPSWMTEGLGRGMDAVGNIFGPFMNPGGSNSFDPSRYGDLPVPDTGRSGYIPPAPDPSTLVPMNP